MEPSQSASRPLSQRIFFSPDERRLRAGWRILAHLILALALFIIFGLLVNALYAPGLLQPGWFPVSLFLEFVVVTMSVFLARRWFDRRTFVSLGLHWSGQALADLLFGILLTGLVFGLLYFVFQAAGWLQFERYAWQAFPPQRVVLAMLGGFLGYVFVGWAEELLSRGYWLQNLAAGLNMFWAVIISSSIFGFLHLGNPNATLIGALGTALAGVLLAYAYLRTRQLWLPIGIHIGWNFFEGNVFGFPVSGTTSSRLIQHTVTGPEIVTGGAFGPEAGLVILPALLLMGAIIFLYTRKR